jgi:hypothetical protein
MVDEDMVFGRLIEITFLFLRKRRHCFGGLFFRYREVGESELFVFHFVGIY